MTLKDKARLSSRKSIVPSKCPFLLFMILRHSHDKAKFANKTLNSTLINSSQIFRRSQKILFFKWVCKFYFSQINANYILFKVSNSFWKRVQKFGQKLWVILAVYLPQNLSNDHLGSVGLTSICLVTFRLFTASKM